MKVIDPKEGSIWRTRLAAALVAHQNNKDDDEWSYTPVAFGGGWKIEIRERSDNYFLGNL